MSDGIALAFEIAKGAIDILGAVAPAALEALRGGKSHEEALAEAQKALPPPLNTNDEDRARRERVRALHPRISVADAVVLRRLVDSPVLTAEERDAISRSADVVETHAAAVEPSPLAGP